MTTTTTTTTTQQQSVTSSSSDCVIDYVVIGAGIAGLSAAYELSKLDQSVLLLESSSRVGGDIYSVDVSLPSQHGSSNHNISLDVGTSEIYGWYRNVLNLLEELNIQTSPIPPRNMYMMNSSNSSSTRGMSKVDAWSCLFSSPEFPLFVDKLLQVGSIRPQDLLMYQVSDTSRLRSGSEEGEDMTVGQFLNDMPMLKATLTTVFEAYSYGDLETMPLSIMLPIFFRVSSSATTLACSGQTRAWIDAMIACIVAEKNETKKTGCIESDVQIININTALKQVHWKTSRDGVNHLSTYNKLIIACSRDSLPFDLDSSSSSSSNDVASATVSPTSSIQQQEQQVISVFVQVKTVPSIQGDNTWTSCVNRRQLVESGDFINGVSTTTTMTTPWQLLYVTNLNHLTSKASCRVLQLCVQSYQLNNVTSTTTASAKLQPHELETALTDLFGCSVEIDTILHQEEVCAFNNNNNKHGVPTNLTAYQALQQQEQGKHDIWYCGQRMGPYPHLEMKCYSGRSVAFQSFDTHMSTAFESWIQSEDVKQAQGFQQRMVAKYLVSSLYAAASSVEANRSNNNMWNIFSSLPASSSSSSLPSQHEEEEYEEEVDDKNTMSDDTQQQPFEPEQIKELPSQSPLSLQQQQDASSSSSSACADCTVELPRSQRRRGDINTTSRILQGIRLKQRSVAAAAAVSHAN